MYLILCLVLICLTIFLSTKWWYRNDYRYKKENANAVVLLVSLVILLFGIPFGSIINETYVIPIPYEENVEIKSLNLNKEMNVNGGGFFLGWSISTDNTIQYIFYINTDNGLILKKSPADITYIIFTKDKPFISVTYHKLKLKYPNWSIFYNEDVKHNLKYTIYVPKDTIKLKYDISI